MTKISKYLDQKEPVLLVGNGLIHGKGELIDSYENVIRFNNCFYDRFPTDYGTKKSLWVSNLAPNIDEAHGSFTFVPYDKSFYPADQIQRFVDKHGVEIFFPEFDPKLFCRRDVPNPTTGYRMAVYLELNHYEVHVIGFDGGKSVPLYNPEHRHAVSFRQNGEKELDHIGKFGYILV